MPQFLTVLQWQAILTVLLAAVIISPLASYLPLSRILHIDPAIVFRT